MAGKFERFLSQLRKANMTLSALTDFDKVDKNVRKIELDLCLLNYLIGKEDLLPAIADLYGKCPDAFRVLPILIAVRDSSKKVVSPQDQRIRELKSWFTSPENIYVYMKETGLAEIFRSRKISNLVDYVFGVEVGMDTNARKNRGGVLMERIVSRLFLDAGIEFRKQVSSDEFPQIHGIGKAKKVFDFVITKGKKTYLIETNFYTEGGSKINDVVKSYIDLGKTIEEVRDLHFVWITDGIGWLGAKRVFEEAFSKIPLLYNLTTIWDFIALLKKP